MNPFLWTRFVCSEVSLQRAIFQRKINFEALEDKDLEYFRIRNWEKYQHRDHKKSMPWIKVHVSLLDDPKMFKLTPYQIGVWFKLMLLCARLENELSTSQHWLRSKLDLKKPVDLALFASLGLIEFFERAESAPRARLEERRGEETIYTPPPAPSDPPKAAPQNIPSHPDLKELWSIHSGSLPKVSEMSEKRRRSWAARWRERPVEAEWIRIIQFLATDDFYSGKSGKWKANVDFLLRPDKHVQLWERVAQSSGRKVYS